MVTHKAHNLEINGSNPFCAPTGSIYIRNDGIKDKTKKAPGMYGEITVIKLILTFCYFYIRHQRKSNIYK